MSSFEPFLKLEKNADNDQTWGDAARANIDALGYALHSQRVMRVDPHWSNANIFPGAGSPGVDRRRFNTIQGAIDAAEANWSGEHYLILVSRGTYHENLTITESVTIAADCGPVGAFYPNVVEIDGSTSTADSVITISPAAGDFVYVQLIGIGLENQHNADVSNPITEPYLIDAQDQASYHGTRSKLVLRGCACRMQTWGGGATNGGNEWTYGIKAKGNWHVVVDGCQLTALSYGGGQLDGIVRRLFHIEGNNAQSITAVCNVKRSDFDNASYDDGTAPVIFYADNRAQIYVNHCSSPFGAGPGIIYTDGGTGTQVFKGIGTSDYIQHMNALAVSGTVAM